MIGLRQLLRYRQTTTKQIPNAKAFIQKFASLQTTLKQQQKACSDLEHQMELAQRASYLTINDYIFRSLSRFTGSNFQSKAIRNLKEQLIMHRQALQSKIHEADLRWQKPREQIIKLRKQLATQFLSKFVKLQQNLFQVSNVQTNAQIKQGLALIHRLLTATLSKHGVTFFQPDLGSLFNSQMHDTVDKGQNGQKIKQVVHRGWKIDQKVIKKPIVRLQ